MFFKSNNESWLFIDIVELLQLYKDATAKLRSVKLGESLTIHEKEGFRISVDQPPIDYNKLVKINKMLHELLRENETDLKQIQSRISDWRKS